MKKRNVNILTGGGGSLLTAFTMAEILLSLTIIGVVAAITLPSLTGNINERTWNTQRKALYARMSQAISLMPALNSYGTLTEDESGSVTADTAAETFITAGLSKVLKINNICDSDHLPDCGIPGKLTTLAASTIDFPQNWTSLNSAMNNALYSTSAIYQSHSLINAAAAAFETANGESIAVYYQPNCVTDMGESNFYMIQPKICANFIFDLNGSKGPNTVGKDIGFITVLYPTDSHVVMPLPEIGSITRGNYATLVSHCRNYDNTRLPIREELAAMFTNKLLLNNSNDNYMSATITKDGAGVYHLFFAQGMMGSVWKDKDGGSVTSGWCVRRN